MLGYSLVGTNDLAKATEFYDALLETVGMQKLFDHPRGGRLYGTFKTGIFGVMKPYDGEPAAVGNGSLCGFGLDSHEQVAAFHAKVLELGGTCEGPPGLRGPSAYFAYFRDLDGNKLCAYKFG
jgi:catechol 2,3-dioxygenase-like lactoylglutathione lyase family enzyme